MRAKIRRSVLGALMAVPLLLAQGAQSNAATVQFESIGVAKGISGLSFEGDTFDISFIHETYAFAFPLGELFAKGLAQSLVNALNEANAISVKIPSLPFVRMTFYVPVGNDGNSFFAAEVQFCGMSSFPPPCKWENPATGIYNINDPRVWAVPVLVTTPLPSALPLFGTALGLLGFMGWRRRRKAAHNRR